MATPPMKTKQRIIQASCELFNEHGERATTTNHIAAHLGISPGNLYYHFRNKEQIIRAIFTEYEQYLEEHYVAASEGPQSRMQGYLDSMFQGMWRFRFLYASLADILARDPELHKRYLQAHERVLQSGIDTLRQLRREGAIAIEDSFLPDFAEGIKLVVTHWVSHLYIRNLDTPITESMVYQGVLQVLALFQGIITVAGRAEFDRLVAHYRLLASRPA
ncbi:TetR/AcrR family transcriptional regulator [Ferrimonas gelatinilytica]|uniref:TetR/AcrR family transcriptional regulator n=1 Tax=Ferrimonas gelatinilytica TaxID=1255257 RepID=A0ABP9S9M0_9GAMM